MADCNIKYCIILNFKVLFVAVLVNMVFVLICLYSAVSSTLVREQHLIKKKKKKIKKRKEKKLDMWCSEI